METKTQSFQIGNFNLLLQEDINSLIYLRRRASHVGIPTQSVETRENAKQKKQRDAGASQKDPTLCVGTKFNIHATQSVAADIPTQSVGTRE